MSFIDVCTRAIEFNQNFTRTKEYICVGSLDTGDYITIALLIFIFICMIVVILILESKKKGGD